MKPIEALKQAILRAFLIDRARTPGAVIARCNTDIRDALTHLTADDAANIRLPENK